MAQSMTGRTSGPADSAAGGVGRAAAAVRVDTGGVDDGAGRRHVLHLTAPAPAGGLESVVLGLARELVERGTRITVVATVQPSSEPHPFVADLRTAGIDVRVLELDGGAYLTELRQLRQLIRDLAPDVVHTHGFRSDVLGMLAARGSGVPLVSTVHGLTGGNWRVRLYERIQLRAYQAFDTVVPVSAPLAELLRRSGIDPGRVRPIPNAWAGRADFLDRDAAREALGLPTRVAVIGWVGRFSLEKGPDLFVDAFADVSDEAHAVMVGDGPELSRIAKRAETSTWSDRIHLTGRVAQAGRLLRACDAVVLSSRTEGTPIILLEAMAARVPIVATHVGGVPDLLSPDEAVLVSTDPLAIAAGIRSVLQDPAAAARRASRAHDRLVRERSAAEWAAAYERVYTAVEESAAAGRR
jgi:glycosyltransferase involved in cell wall biosynthesis